MGENDHVIFADDRHIWEQQPRESGKQYSRFKIHRDAGPLRTLIDTIKTITETDDPITYRSLVKLASKFRWNERVSAWDRHLESLEFERTRKLRTTMIDNHMVTANSLLHKALTALTTTKTEELNPKTIAIWIKLGTDIQMRALGEPTKTIGITGPTGGPIQTEDLTNLTDEERRTRLRDLAIEVAHRAGLTTIDNTED